MSIAFDEYDLIRSTTRESYFAFVQEFWEEFCPEKPVWNWHIEYICDELQKVAERVFAGKPKEYDLLINVCPGSTKSSVASVAFVPWCWTRMPTLRSINGSHTHDLVLDLSRKSRDIIRSEKYQKCFPEIIMREDQDTKGYYINTKGGSRFCATVGGKTPTGMHAHIQVIDDPIDPEKAKSDIEIAMADSWMVETLSTRKIDKAITPLILIMQRLAQCLLPGTMVRRPGAPAAIEAIKKGQLVLGTKGWQKVTNTSTTYYDGIAYGVKAFGHPEICWTTDHHRYWTKRGWIRADELSKYDKVHLPSFVVNKDVPWEDVKLAPPPKRPTGTFVNAKRYNGVSEEELRKLANQGLTNTEISAKLDVHRNTIHNYMYLYQISRVVNRNPIFGVDHLKDSEFWRFVGYWLAEGFFIEGRGKDPVGVQLTFGYSFEEKLYVQDVVDIFWKYGVPVIVSSTGSTTRATIHCSQLAKWLKKYFGKGAHNKRIPLFVFGMEYGLRLELLNGWTCGDGCNYKGGSSVSTVSEALRDGMHLLCASLNKLAFASDSGKKHGKVREIFGLPNKAFSSGKACQVRYDRVVTGNKERYCEKTEEGFWYNIQYIKTKSYDGPVYDITTPSHNFVVGNATIHNCDPAGMMIERSLKRGKLKHICIPAELTDDVRPESLRKYYVEGLMDPVRIPREVLQEEEEKGDYFYSGQFRQNPIPIGGGMFKADCLKEEEMAPNYWHFKKIVRYWDNAGTPGRSKKIDARRAYSVGVKMGLHKDGSFWILDVVRGRWRTDDRERMKLRTARLDGVKVRILQEQEPGSGGQDVAEDTVRNLAGYSITLVYPKGEKEYRADPFSKQVNIGNVHLVKADWNHDFLQEMRHYPFSTFKDQIDASSGAFSEIHKLRRKVGVF